MATRTVISSIPEPPARSTLVARNLLSATPKEREVILQDVEYNVFAFPAGLITCDFLSDSGTSAMTDVQWAAMLRGDESYGRNWGYYCLLDAFRDIFERGDSRERVFENVLAGSVTTDFYRKKLLRTYKDGFVNGGPPQLERPNFFIVPQGRCAENLLFSTLGAVLAQQQPKGEPGRHVLISNGFFDTTAANASVAGFELQVFTKPGLSDPFPTEQIGVRNNFKGDLDVAATRTFLDANPGKVRMILLTITNNWAAAQPVSMANIRDSAALAQEKGIPFFFDACRFAENAYFIQRYEYGYANMTIGQIVQEMFTYADGFTISLKKDGLANMGGVVCFKDNGIFPQMYDEIGLLMKEKQIVTYGNDSYGGMSGRDLMAATVGLYEVTKRDYLHGRIYQVQEFAQKLISSGIACLSPPGGHAVFLDMDDFFRGCGRKPDDYASVGFSLELIKDYGIRAIESGPFGWGWDQKTPEEQAKIPNLVRFAVPRHVMTSEHINYTVAAVKELYSRRHTIPNVVISRGKTMRLRHFSCGLTPVPVVATSVGSFLERSSRKLEQLSTAVGGDESQKKELLEALALSTGSWGRTTVPAKADLSGRSWISSVSNDHSPIELSVAMLQKTGSTEVRFVVEAQPTENTLESVKDASLRLNQSIQSRYGSHVSFEQLDRLSHLFLPDQPDAKSTLIAWHSFVASKAGPEWKIYLDPRALGQDKANSTIQEAFDILNMSSAWTQLQSTKLPGDRYLYFSLDLLPASSGARVKVYVAHPHTTAVEVAARHTAICPDADSYEIQRFCRALSGGSRGPYHGKPVVSCFAFTFSGPDRPVGTVHFPADAHTASDEEVRSRIERYLDGSDPPVSPLFRERYRKALAAVQGRPLATGAGIHSWVSLKMKRGELQNTFYFSPELFGPVNYASQYNGIASKAGSAQISSEANGIHSVNGGLAVDEFNGLIKRPNALSKPQLLSGTIGLPNTNGAHSLADIDSPATNPKPLTNAELVALLRERLSW